MRPTAEELAENAPSERRKGMMLGTELTFRARKRRLPDELADRLFWLAAASAAVAVLVILSGAALSMLWGGRLAFETFGWKFFTSADWDAVAHKFGALIPIYGTLVSSFLALLVAVPISFGIAMFLTEIAPGWMKVPVGTAIELLAAIPSIIYGMWGLFVFAPVLADYVEPWLIDKLGNAWLIGPLFSGAPIGLGMLPAGLILGIMIIPFITAVMRDVFDATPQMLKESAFALGATRWEVIRKVVLPYTRSAVVGAIFLGLERALGETMAVTFVLGNAHELSVSLLAPGNSIAATLANEFTEADSPMYLSSLIALGFVLFIVTFIVLALAKLLLLRLNRMEGAK
ncbi:phosphate transporter permease subunit PstC [Caballeronia arationis]|uniref:phosphate ABC transporter permease subunit PstC n=1 Tax=Caballeronia arationis TaxID=1777142 RepID=UPI00074BF541|nr:phosphate ABC transporter permease subunit PstC [Caballeronia arationis]SAK95028.1 phosphate transporter permease subunit PstC [Caballeronia arationis]